jgi:hypothetical protein
VGWTLTKPREERGEGERKERGSVDGRPPRAGT